MSSYVKAKHPKQTRYLNWKVHNAVYVGIMFCLLVLKFSQIKCVCFLRILWVVAFCMQTDKLNFVSHFDQDLVVFPFGYGLIIFEK